MNVSWRIFLGATINPIQIFLKNLNKNSQLKLQSKLNFDEDQPLMLKMMIKIMVLVGENAMQVRSCKGS
jgi:hypothetical protein